jgi:hypothetical protein
VSERKDGALRICWNERSDCDGNFAACRRPIQLFADARTFRTFAFVRILPGVKPSSTLVVAWDRARVGCVDRQRNSCLDGIQTQFDRRSFRHALKILRPSLGAHSRNTVKLREVSDELEGRDACHHDVL